MIIIMKDNAAKTEIAAVEEKLTGFGFQTHPIYGEKKTVIGYEHDWNYHNSTVIVQRGISFLSNLLSLNAFNTTNNELKLIQAEAIIGVNTTPIPLKTPAAIGIEIEL